MGKTAITKVSATGVMSGAIQAPTLAPTSATRPPTSSTLAPTSAAPTHSPTVSTVAPTLNPTVPTQVPTNIPTHVPPTNSPTQVPTLTTAVPTSMPTALPTKSGDVPGLTPEQAAAYNPHLASYWDLDHCGKGEDNHNWDWCGLHAYTCPKTLVVNSSLCPSQMAVLNFTRTFADIDGCLFAYHAQYICTSASTTTTTTTTSETTSTSTSTIIDVDGLTPEEARVYNPQLASYWDFRHCGKARDDHNLAWCEVGPSSCHESVTVDFSLCPSGAALLNFTRSYARIDGCVFAFYSQYVCKQAGQRRLRHSEAPTAATAWLRSLLLW